MARSKPNSVPQNLRRRLRELRGRFDSAAVDALLVTYPPDQFYLTGAVLEDSAVLVTPRTVVVVTDSRFDEQVGLQSPWCRKVLRRDGLADAIAALLGEITSARTVGVQAEHLPLADYNGLVRKLGKSRLAATRGLVAAGRLIKDDAEVAQIVRAIRAAERGYRATLENIRPGLREREIAAELEYRMRQFGASGSSFEPIVAVGPRGSLPHARAADVKARAAQPILFDWGARVGGYCSDLTRVFRLARVPARLREIYPIVLEAQLAGIDAVRPGAAARDVDAAARKIIEQAGYGKQFGHGLGHGIGLDIHEGPRLSARSDDVLAPGMVVTVEPGIYLPGVGGVRIEDDVLVTATGRRVLSKLDKTWPQ